MTPPTAIYTGATELPVFWALPYQRGAEQQNLATCEGDPMLIKCWSADKANPLVAAPPATVNVTGFRDPAVSWDSTLSKWRMLLGSGIERRYGAVLIYHAPALEGPWSYRFEP